MYKFIGKVFNIAATLALGYTICYFDWLPGIIDWVKNIIQIGGNK
jgi:hypothetical protein